jgi:hypothetical protein
MPRERQPGLKLLAAAVDSSDMEVLESREPRPITGTSTLGDLLTKARCDAGRTIEDVALRSAVPVEQIREVESSRYSLSPAELAEVLDGYGVPSADGRLARTVVVISLEDGWISMKETRRIWKTQAEADRNLLRYLLLVCEGRGLSMGERIPFRSVDLSLLRASLAIRRSEVEAHLDNRGWRVPERLRRNKSLLAVAATAGVTVAAGAIILVPAGSKESASSPASGTQDAPPVELVTEPVDQVAPGSDPRIEIGTALVVERSPAAAADDDVAVDGAVTVDPGIEIGTAVVIERPAVEAAPIERPASSKTSRGPPVGESADPKGNK